MADPREPRLDPRIQRLVARDPSLGTVARQFAAHMLEEREALIQMLIQLARDKEQLRLELLASADRQPATLPMGRPET